MNLKELSKLLGLSPTTVSRALNGYPEVNAATRMRVTEAALKHGYSPNLLAKRLATGRTLTIGHVVPLSVHQMINPIFADFIAGAGEVYSTSGYDMLISVVPPEQEHAAYRKLATQRGVDGFIVHGPTVTDPRIALLQELGIPFLVHGRGGPSESNYSWLDINNRRGFLRATELLLDLGHRRIALLNGHETMSFAARRRQGFDTAMAERNVPVDPALLRSEEMIEPFGFEAARQMLSLDRPPTAFLVSSMMIALGVLRAAQERGLEPGRDLSIVTHDDDLSFLPNHGAIPLFTATRSSIREAGRRAAEILIEIMTHPGTGPRQELWESDLTIGLSTGPRPKET